MLKRVAIYCGSRPGKDSAYKAAAEDLAGYLARHGIGIVYGGSQSGLMGVVAETALKQGGEVIGVIPQKLLHHEIEYPGLTEVHHVASMHERKQLMAELADGFIALPGGLGTLDELIEVFSWANMGHHKKPCACYEVNDYWQPLFDLLEHFHTEGFAQHSQTLLRARNPEAILALLQSSYDSNH